MDLQFSIAFVTASSPAYLHINQGSAIAFDIAVMVLNCLWATNGLISVRWESVVLMRVFLCMSLIKPCYCLLSLHLMVTTVRTALSSHSALLCHLISPLLSHLLSHLLPLLVHLTLNLTPTSSPTAHWPLVAGSLRTKVMVMRWPWA